MFDRFTDRAKTALNLARQEAQRLNHEYLGTEHILLGLVQDGGGVAAHVLTNMGVDLATVRRGVENIVKSGPSMVTMGQLPFTPRAKKVLELSMEEASNLRDNYIGTEHLLLGLIKEREGIAAQVLKNLGVTLEDMRRDVRNWIGGDDDEDANPQPPVTASTHETQPATVKTPMLDTYGRDLNQLARQDSFDPCVGRERELERVVQILARRSKGNAVLLGPSGAGKTAIVQGLAQRIVAGEAAPHISGKRIIALDLALLVAGTHAHGEFERRFEAVINETRSCGDVILFFERLELLVGACGANTGIDAADMLTPALARGEIQCVGESTADVYRERIATLSALERHFQSVVVEAPSPEETLAILRGVRGCYEAHHRVRYSDAALNAAVELTLRHVPQRALPDKALDALDEAGARVSCQPPSKGSAPEVTAADVARAVASMASAAPGSSSA